MLWVVMAKNQSLLMKVIKQVGVELEQDYAQMKMMDLENNQLHQKAFTKAEKRENLHLGRHAT